MLQDITRGRPTEIDSLNGAIVAKGACAWHPDSGQCLYYRSGKVPRGPRLKGSVAMRSAVVLAGGEARRANGQEKYFFTYEGKTFIERLVDSLSGVVDEIIIVARSPVQCTRS